MSDAALASSLADAVAARQDDMHDLLETLVCIESPSDDPAAIAAVHEPLIERFAALGFAAYQTPPRDGRGPHLYARPQPRTPSAPLQLLVGHCDTVWPHGTLEQMPFEIDDNVIRGPGVFDMKGGLAQLLTALHALRDVGLDLGTDLPVTPVVFINADEEVGSPTSARHIHRLARCAHRAFVVESALGLDGKIKTARKGTGRYTIRIQGKSAHAGLDPESGASAILELSHVVQAVHDLSDPEAGLTVNVGTIEGGTRPNVIAAESRAEVDVRVTTGEQMRHVDAALHNLEATTPGTTLEISGGVGRPPMEFTERSRQLWEHTQTAAAWLNLPLDHGRSGGASDGNLTSQHAPTLDGLGPVGDGAHARREFCYADKMVERAALLAVLLTLPAAHASADAPHSPEAASAV
jgi:glutamate carboxypeptidase